MKQLIDATKMKQAAITAKIVLLSSAMMWLGNGCNLDTYEFGDKAGWHIPDASEVDAGPIIDAGPDACVPTEEVCDGKDNNCDGIIDDGFDLENDPENCGECNNVCEFDNAFAHCEEGECVMGACMPGYWDLNEDDSDGCEYGCLPTNGGVETCDGRDNNCDGETDEGFDLDNDPMHCGECNNVCVFFKGEGACVGGECVLDYCYSGYVNKDGDDTNGCECMINAPEDAEGAVCEPTEQNPCGEGEVCVDRDLDGEFHCSAIPPDLCNGVDTNCNGETDEDAPVGEPCYTNPTGCSYDEGTDTWTCEGECTTGTIQCTGGMMQCVGQKGPSMEMCNGQDDNCNGETDEDFDFENDPMNCGGCGNTCTTANVPNAIAGCENGGCVVVACMPGFHNLDGEHATGCEYECTYTNGGVEVCGDGIDNNCNGETDEGFDFENDPQHCGGCNNECKLANAVSDCQAGSCVLVECLDGYWDVNNDPSDGCEYGCATTNGGVEICDGLDNDCNGVTDDGFDLMNDPNNCGECNRVCSFVNAEASCVAGECALDYCHSGFVDKDANPGNGCECEIAAPEDQNGAECDPTVPDPCAIGEVCVDEDSDGVFHCSAIPPDLCDGVDNNCNGETDEDAPVGEQCYTHVSGCSYDDGTDTWTCFGECSTGTTQCNDGGMECVGDGGPSVEICDGLDNNCDGVTDDGFDFLNDHENCGGCGITCTQDNVPNSVPGCENGNCVVVACLPGYHDLDGDPSNGCEYECTYTNGGVELCGDSIDNDCNGETDEGFDFQNDPQHCGGCNNVCQYPNAVADCEGGSCVMVECQPGFWDVNNDSSDGCEYACTETNNGVEICDGKDNNCNAQTDEGFDTSSDVQNCGSCGYACSAHIPAGAQVVSCTDGKCVYSCLGGFHDLNGDLVFGAAGNGCEYECTPSNGGVEICDGADNNCDGNTDADGNGYPLTQACYTGLDGTEGVGICKGGTSICTGGGWGECGGEVTPEAYEQCDDLDHNCDGDPMDGFDLTSDVLHCGGCGNSCFDSMPDNSYASGCSASTCEYECQGGFHNLDGDWSNGCEYECWQTTAPGVEYCDGIDNNCDGDTDTEAYLEEPPEGFCRADLGTPCEGTEAVCTAGINGVAWYCNYSPNVETDPTNPNRVLLVETLCNGVDGNCNGLTDESFPDKGEPCDDGLLGVCRGTGVYQCNTQQDGTECNITNPGESPQPEVCDGIDNDCDGLTDESFLNPGSDPSYVVDDTTEIEVNGETVFMYSYEASRPSATSGSAGVGTNVRACSRPDVLPWNKVTYEQARQACIKAGMTLCADEEWVEGCDGAGTTWAYPYHSSDYDGAACNTHHASYGTSVPTGSMPDCASQGYGIEDLSGNLREWTSSIVGYTTEGKAIYSLRGGSYTDMDQGSRCDFTQSAFVEDAFAANVGFRCCSRCGNGVLDPGEECDWAVDANCTRACGPPTCGDGVVDAREDCDCGTDPNNLPLGCIDINGAPASNCAINCTRPEERCSTLYPEDQDAGGEAEDCDDPACQGLVMCLDHTDADGDGWTVAMGDCDDNDPDVYPGAPIVCNDGKDNNCNGFIDDDEPDVDGDGYPPCLGGAVYDCDDNDPEVHPGALEICGDGIDNNCDGLTDANCATECEIAEYERSYIGCEYYAASTVNTQLDNAFNSNYALVVHNPNTQPVNIVISKNGVQVETDTVAANEVQPFLLPFDLTLKNTKNQLVNVSGGAYHLVSDLPVTVYQFNPFDYYYNLTYSHSNDASLVLPKHVLSRNYMITGRPTWMGYGDIPLPGFFAVIGTENNTQIEVTYSAHVENGPNAGSVVTYTLNAGDVIQVPSRQCNCGATHCYCPEDYDFTGTEIRVLNPTGHEIAVFAGHDCTFIPENEWACDHLETQMFPLETWGKNFVATLTDYPNETTDINYFRVVSGENNNVIVFDPASVQGQTTLNSGDFIEFPSTQHFSVECSEVCAVTQFIVADDLVSGDSDPGMALLVPVEQFRKNYTFLVPSSMTYNYVNIIKPVGIGAPTVYMDGVPIDEADFGFAIGNSYYGVARVNISSAPYAHTLESDGAFGIMVYGFARYTSYFYPGGLDLNIINVLE